MERIRRNLQHIFFETVYQMIAPTEKRSKWWLQLNQWEPLVQ